MGMLAVLLSNDTGRGAFHAHPAIFLDLLMMRLPRCAGMRTGPQFQSLAAMIHLTHGQAVACQGATTRFAGAGAALRAEASAAGE